MANRDLPIWNVARELLAALQQQGRFVLVAPTGSGKTTQVPQILLEANLRPHQQIVILQPRRVAARSVALRVAHETQSHLGTLVGYQVRFDDQISETTRVAFITEGILLRWLQDDPELKSIGILLFDEFHERNLLSDVALGLARRLQQTSRPDLLIGVMSATLDAEPVAQYLHPCPIVVSEGQSWPVSTHYIDYGDQRPIPEQAASQVEHILRQGESGDILVFMPGMGEIMSTIHAIRSSSLGERVLLLPLHGELPPQEQDLAFAPSPLRKIVVATNVAETSITIDGIRHVVDSGVARVARYDAERGLATLRLEEISRASADQRKGRAGRTAPGTCWRLWTESGHLNRPERNTPEIQRADLAETVLLLHSLGIRQARSFNWLDQPDPEAVERAESLLCSLGALVRPTPTPTPIPIPTLTGETPEPNTPPPDLDITPIGRKMLALPMHPRYSRLLVEASRYQCVPLAALCAALVSGRDLLTRISREESHIREARELFEASNQSDFYTLIRAYQFAKQSRFDVDRCRRYGIHARVAREVEQTHQQFLELARRARLITTAPSTDAREEDIDSETRPPQEDPLLRCLAVAFADQLAVRKDSGTLDCHMSEGRIGTLARESVVQDSPLLAIASVREIESKSGGRLTLLTLATAIRKEWLEELFPHLLRTRIVHTYDRTQKRVAALRLVHFLDLVVDQKPHKDYDDHQSGLCLAKAFTQGWFELPQLTHDLKQFIARVNLVAAAQPGLEFPQFNQETLTQVFARAFHGLTLAKEAQAADLQSAFLQSLAPAQREWLQELAPTHITWHDNRKLKLTYLPEPLDDDLRPNPPELQVKLHECFPLKDHPRILENALPVKLWLAGPDGKRIAPTLDWPAYKAKQYPRERAALMKKYPGVGWL